MLGAGRDNVAATGPGSAAANFLLALEAMAKLADIVGAMGTHVDDAELQQNASNALVELAKAFWRQQFLGNEEKEPAKLKNKGI